MDNPSINDIIKLLKKTTNYEFHYNIWISFLKNIGYDAKDIHTMLKKFQKNNYFVEFNNEYNYNPLVKAVVNTDALKYYHHKLDKTVADSMALAFMDEITSNVSVEYDLNTRLFESIIGSLDCEKFFKTCYDDIILFYALEKMESSSKNLLSETIFNPNNKSKTFKVGKAYAFWSIVVLDLGLSKRVLDLIFEDPEMIVNELYVDDLKNLLDNPSAEINELPHASTIKSVETLNEVMKYIKSKPDFELLLRLYS